MSILKVIEVFSRGESIGFEVIAHGKTYKLWSCLEDRERGLFPNEFHPDYADLNRAVILDRQS